MKKKSILDYLVMFSLIAMLAVQTTSLSTTLFATDTTGPELSDILESTDSTSEAVTSTPDATDTTVESIEDQGNSVIDGIAAGLDHSDVKSEAVDKFGKTFNRGVGIVIQIIAYIITGAMTISKLIDIIYVGIPLTRTFLANGYVGNAAAAGTPGGQMNGMAGGMMGGPGMMGGGMMGGGMMGGYGRGRYGMGGGMMGGMGPGMGMGMGGMDGQMAMQNQPARGRIQFVSNAALNAVATESVVGTDGKGQSAWKLYFSDMLVSSIACGILIVLCITGIMQKFGFLLGDFIVGVVNKISL